MRNEAATSSRLAVALVAVATLLGVPTEVDAQGAQSLLSDDPSPVGAGRIVLELGSSWLSDTRFEASGLEGNLLQTPDVGLRVGLGDIAEFHVETGVNVLSIERRFPAPLAGDVDASKETTADILDPIVATKVRLWEQAGFRPAVAFRAATRLPVASNESGLGLDTSDFFVSLLAGAEVARTRVVGNLGLGVLGVPTHPNRQNDVVTYALSVARPIRPGVTLVGEVGGRFDPSGVEWPGLDDSGRLLLGGQIGSGATRFDAGVIVGFEEADPDLGLVVGLTRTLRAPRP